LHFKLPNSELNQQMAAVRPGVFGDTGLTSFLKALFDLGATRPNLDVKLVGGSKSNGGLESFDIGARNLLLARRFLWMNGLIVSREDTGGSDYRTVRLEMAGGRVVVKDPHGSYEI
jgi:chemotaxis protein CheD